MDFITLLLAAAIASGTPLLIATLGGILSERAGIIQLGTEGIMLMGAVSACLVYIRSGSLWAALAAVVLVSAALGLVHAFMTVTLRANHIVSGLAMTLFGAGLSAYLGKPVAGQPLPGAFPRLELAFLDGVPFLGPIFGRLDWFTWISFALALGLHLLIHRTSWGLHLRAMGDNPATADVMGIPVQAARYAYVVGGAVLIGLAGANMLLVYSPTWNEGMTAGRGWIAVALIIFARWNPLRALLCAYFFGALDSIGFRIQLEGSLIPSYFLKMIPYVVTILVLMYLGWRGRGKPSGSPESLGLPYIREQRL
ncbi:ABC transporter permease [Paenibacillus pasadenensis]|uniref:Putative deoxyribose-specific ABC transporter, permease protein n=1 Tax=Paenibacillus pasadenensis TaxID=217090 RepID=A0A2N5NAT4_9BACL|nr:MULTISPECIES: ABC transporter permease [Paenibacillus]PLT47466.1 putative deoxyribose-specific ABC transporter, permease protein [Paenibacillus pasadenensis]QGG57718.1 ABC transporter permease [Paenibacillus sp. B01]